MRWLAIAAAVEAGATAVVVDVVVDEEAATLHPTMLPSVAAGGRCDGRMDEFTAWIGIRFCDFATINHASY